MLLAETHTFRFQTTFSCVTIMRHGLLIGSLLCNMFLDIFIQARQRLQNECFPKHRIQHIVFRFT